MKKAELIESNLPKVVLVGRTNVGKSTIFNRLIEKDMALISNIAGTTRTSNVGIVSWRGKNFELIDTGGLTFDDEVILEEEIIKQTEKSLKTAELIVFVIDIQTDPLPQEKELVQLIKRKYQNKPLIFVANKADNPSWQAQTASPSISKLQLGEPMPISGANGTNLGDMLDLIFKSLNKLPKRPKAQKELNPINVAIVGKPNVGKSALFNKIIGQEKVIVSDMAHTTREPYDTLVEYDKKPILFIDTAGIRKKSKVSGLLEILGISKSIKSIKKSDVTLLVLDATEPVTDQDQQLAGLLRQQTKSVIIIINKWDKAEDNTDNFRNQVKDDMYALFPHLKYAPILFTSAKTKYKIHQIFPLILRAFEERYTEISEETLEDFLEKIMKKRLPLRGKGVRHPKVLGLSQLNSAPPIFQLAVKNRTSVHPSYLHYISNRLRENFSFFACPIIVKIKKIKK